MKKTPTITPPTSVPTQQERILEEFTRRAEAFATAPPITDSAALALLVQQANAGPQDTVLDVACGAGQVVCAFAPVVRHATGVDITPAMIQRAQRLQEEKGLRNVSWQVADILPLPYGNESFSIVVCRYALHHMENPAAVVAEMARVCASGGRVVICDLQAPPEPAKAAELNRMERLRDPSHVRALPTDELCALLRRTGLEVAQTEFYGMDWALETVLQGSSPRPGDLDLIRQMFVEDLKSNAMGLEARLVGDELWFTYPIVVVAAKKPLSVV